MAFEPDRGESENITHNMSRNMPYARFHVAPCAVGRENGSASMNLYETPSNNSFFAVNRRVADRYNIKTFVECGTQSVPTTNLDTYLFEKLGDEGHWGEMLKLDTQGMEFGILEGAQRTLAERTVAIIAEVEFFRMYNDQPLFSEVEQLLRSNGFAFYGFTKMSYRSRKQMDKHTSIGRERILWADAVFFKDPFPGGFWNKPLTDRQNYALFSSALLLGYYDFALEVALKTWAHGEETERIKALVRNCATAPPEDAVRALRELTQRVEARPYLANIEIGRFIDQRRFTWDYDDVPNIE
ncbi:MAG: FkbM family [Geobacteraceae bacterium]|nr:MAG: FkbM family [Geobacteraceae bacterium]